MKDFDSIDKALDIESSIVESEPAPISKKKEERNKSEIQKDYEYTRGQLYSLIEKGQETLNGIMELADETQSPRAYEVAGQLIKNVADSTDKLIDLQKKLRDLDEDPKSKNPTTVNNTMFVGSTADLAKFLKKSQDDIQNT
jgi:hypothetical protein|tara:strand:- start:26736 stop:27158 length:423 start_codon:yes stop_codon:yes gene_type:complete